MGKNIVKEEHLKDIDFRTWEQRSKSSTEEFIKWYEILHESLKRMESERTQAQLHMISAVLWHLLPPKEYKKLTRRKPLIELSGRI